MEVLEAIRTRRSIRKFTDQDVSDELVEKILTAGIWAPSGKNNQLWRFAVVKDPQFKAELAKLTKHTDILENAPVLILVFVDHTVTYDAVKDANSIGACVQNMLLAIHSLGLAAVWIAEILKNKDEVKGRCQAPDPYELMAVVALGYGAETGGQGTRNGLEDVVFLRK
ncbi:nitroreductase family protein [candidate division KSB3 bacterium]|uniref:Nitroreductase family protein n=1 Tax=candidate division KSB3 bacterium TaxID=2044937 RepID=A0A9D5JUQ3_9BACT|nr:nitroreductase family protein [candidate division KSB3 bacterium]MBD3324602.1 nitroreductase family protein [candidate division KSB3 bacterium]